jgi:DNA-binding MarR family transcriptional regulator
MDSTKKPVKLTQQQQHILTLLFKFRFVSTKSLAQILSIRTDSTYEILERLVANDFVVKIYEKSFRIDRKPAYYYLSKSGVSTVRGLMDVRESVVHALYKNNTASPEFIEHSLDVLTCYPSIKQNAPEGTDLFTKTEVSRFKQFPKNRPDLYVRTTEGSEAMVVFAHDILPYVINKRLDEIVAHSEDEGWDGEYPRIAFVLKDTKSKNAFLYKTAQKLDSLGMDEDDLMILATTIEAAASDQESIWASVFVPQVHRGLFE